MIKVTLRDTTTQVFDSKDAFNGYCDVHGYEIAEINTDGKIEKPTFEKKQIHESAHIWVRTK